MRVVKIEKGEIDTYFVGRRTEVAKHGVHKRDQGEVFVEIEQYRRAGGFARPKVFRFLANGDDGLEYDQGCGWAVAFG